MMYTLQSKTDNRIFQVNQKVIDASEFLKNLCELTEITEPIVLDCSTHSLMTYINLINHYDTITKYHDREFEYKFFKNFNDFMVAELIKETAYLDSDFFNDAVADIILDRIKEMSWKKMQEYFGVEDDFTQYEQKQIEADKLDFLIHGQQNDNKNNFLTLQNKFYTPMNAFLARVIQRSNGKISFTLSMINKTFKNEVNRHPIKVTNLEGGHSWRIEIYGILNMGLSETDIQTYFDAFKHRKIFVNNKTQMFFKSLIPPKTMHSTSLDFVIPRYPKLNVYFSKNANQIYNFDIQKCPFPFIRYEFSDISIDFDKVYQQLIAKDLSKDIWIFFKSAVNFLRIEFLKKTTNASRFCTIGIYPVSDETSFQAVKLFIKKYMEDDGIIHSWRKLFDSSASHKGFLANTFYYKVSAIKKYL